jgi:hypothetical protein
MGRRRRKRHARGRPDSRLGGRRARAERTRNMAYMVVTLEVSRLSDWLNADAACRAESRACDAERGARREAGGRGAAAAQAACTRKARLKALRPQGTRGVHPEHRLHGRDLGGVEAHWLIERRRGLPIRREKHAMQTEVRAGRREGMGRRRRRRHARGRPDSRPGGRRARAERTWNIDRMVVTLEVSRLSGWLNADAVCRVERRGMRCGARCAPGGGRAWGGDGASGMHEEGPTQGLEAAWHARSAR